MAPPFPHSPIYAGFDAPCRFEGEVFELAVHGNIPEAIDGTFYRVMPDPQVPLQFDDDIYFNGDGSVSAFRVHKGHVDFKQKYVRTERFVQERAARSALFGRYRNRYTDNPKVKDLVHSTGNTNILYYRGALLALKEDSPPYAMDPDTLETLGIYDFDGQVTTPTFTAHPKLDPKTGELICMGYEAKGDATRDVVYYLIDKQGGKAEEVWFEAPWSGMMHDLGGLHFEWDPERPAMHAMMPRRGATPDQVRWFKSKNGFLGHVSNAFEKDGVVHLDSAWTSDNVFSFFPDKNGHSPDPRTLKSFFARWTFDYNAKSDYVEPDLICDVAGEFPKSDDRFLGQSYKHAYLNVMDHTKPWDINKCGPPIGGFGALFNCLGHIDVSTGKLETWFAGPTSSTQEPVFIPRSADAEEGDGWVLALKNNHDTNLSDLVILDTRNFTGDPVAVINLPLRLRTGFHGNWVPAEVFTERKELCDMTLVPGKIPNRATALPTTGVHGTNGVSTANKWNPLTEHADEV